MSKDLSFVDAEKKSLNDFENLGSLSVTTTVDSPEQRARAFTLSSKSSPMSISPCFEESIDNIDNFEFRIAE